MAGNNAPEVYRGRRKRLNVLGIVLGVLVALILLTVVLFFGLQKYIVFGHDGISVVLPGAGASADGVPGGEEAPMQVGATLSISDPDYSSLAATAGEDLRDIVAVFVPAADVNTQGVSRYMSVMDYYSGANALVLEVKPASGQLVWSSSSPTAAGYGLSGSVDLAALIAAIRQQSPDIYLVAQISCFVDSLLAERSSGSVLRLAGVVEAPAACFLAGGRTGYRDVLVGNCCSGFVQCCGVLVEEYHTAENTYNSPIGNSFHDGYFSRSDIESLCLRDKQTAVCICRSDNYQLYCHGKIGSLCHEPQTLCVVFRWNR